MPQIPRLASLGDGAKGNHRPHYSADWQSGIVPSQSLRTSKPATLFPATPANPNKIKGDGNPVFNHIDLLSQRKKSVITDSYVTF
ncbi:hypothetical protein [Aeromonas veronii]|uniref:hypothetical protein n=1 Tax=Aeromonas veronii TaxID=654 RepID=UPI003B9FDFB0